MHCGVCGENPSGLLILTIAFIPFYSFLSFYSAVSFPSTNRDLFSDMNYNQFTDTIDNVPNIIAFKNLKSKILVLCVKSPTRKAFHHFQQKAVATKRVRMALSVKSNILRSACGHQSSWSHVVAAIAPLTRPHNNGVCLTYSYLQSPFFESQ